MSAESPEQQSATAAKLSTARQKKDTADQAFKAGQTKDALRSYHEALMYLVGLDKSALKSIGVASPPPSPAGQAPQTEKTEVDEIVEKIYANMSACHLKQENWKRAVETADKALAKNENNYKAMYRKGKALGEQGFIEKSLKILEDLKTKNPDDTALVDAEVARLKAIDNEREKAHKQKLKGFLMRDRSDKKPAQPEASAPASEA